MVGSAWAAHIDEWLMVRACSRTLDFVSIKDVEATVERHHTKAGATKHIRGAHYCRKRRNGRNGVLDQRPSRAHQLSENRGRKATCVSQKKLIDSAKCSNGFCANESR